MRTPERRVLVLPLTRRDGEVTLELLARSGLDGCVCNSVSALTAQVKQGVGTIVLTEAALCDAAMEELLAVLALQPAWSDVPVVVLARHGQPPPAAAGVLGRLSNVTLLDRPASTRSVLSAVQSALRARERQYQIRDQLQAQLWAQAALRRSEQRLALAFETLPMGIGVIDATGSLVMLNDGMRHFLPTGTIPSRDSERMGRWCSWDAAGRRVEPEDFPGARALRGETVNPGMQMLYLDDDGRQTWTEVRSAPLRDGEGDITGALLVVIDVDRLKRSEEVARQAQERQAFLLKLSDALRARPDEASIKDQTVRMLAEHLHLDRCWISEMSESQGISTVGPEHLRTGLAPMSGVFRLSDVPEAMLRLATQPTVIHDAANDAGRPDSEKALLAGLRLRALLVAPLRKGQRHVVCALAAAMATPRQWSDGEQVLLEEVAERMWNAVERARGEVAAARAERRAEAIIERMGDAHCVLDRNFHIQSVNAATERLLGLSRSALVGRSHWDVFPASADAPVGHTFRRVVAEGIEQHLTHHYTGEGYDMHIELDAYPTDEGGVAMFWRDVTERVKAELALRESEEKYRALFNKMDEAYAVVEVLKDEQGAWGDFRFLEVNPAFMQHTAMPYPVGKTATQLLGTPNPLWAQIYGQVLDSGEPVRVEQSEPTLGRTFDLNIFVLERPRHRVAVLFSNITQRKATEEALRQSEERLRLAVNVGELATWDWDLATGQVVWSPAHFRMQGYAPGEVEPSYQAWIDRVHPQDRASAEAALQHAREQHLPYTHEFRIVRADGTVRWLSAQGCYYHDDTGTAVRMIGVMRDVSEQRHARELLEQQVAERTRALRQLLVHMETLQDDERRRIARELHDGLGQYLTSVTLAVNALRQGCEHDSAVGDRLQRLNEVLHGFDQELDRVIFLLRPTALEDGGLGEGVSAYARTWSEPTGVTVDLELQGLDAARLDAAIEAAVFRIVQEALNNVAKYAQASQVSVSLGRRRSQLVGSIEDDGVGFDVADAMAPRAGRSRWGLLGMRERIEALGGTFAIESQPGRGTAVLLRLPLR